MELLWMDTDFNVDFRDPEEIAIFEMTVGTQGIKILGWDDPRVIMFQTVRTGGFPNVFGPNDTGMVMLPTMPLRYDWQTRDGRGFLLPSDKFNISIKGEFLSGSIIFSVNWRLWYRFVEIPIAEFVGIVQSFQAT